MGTLDRQEAYYDYRWSQRNYINDLELERLLTIIQLIRATKKVSPTILDLGCGTGWLTSILNEIGPATGIELSGHAIENARLRYPSVEFICGNFFDVEIKRDQYDIVISQEVIEHVEDQDGYLRIAEECLRSEGFLILTTPNAYNFSRWTSEALDNWSLQPIEKWLDGRSLRRLIETYFDIICITTVISGYGNQGIYRLINSVKFNRVLSYFRLTKIISSLLLRLGLGLHLCVLAKTRRC